MRHVLSVLHGNTFGGPHNRNTRVVPVLARDHGVDTTVMVPAEPGDAAERMRRAGLDVVEIRVNRIRATADPRCHVRFLFGFIPAVQRIRRVIRERKIALVQINGVSNPHAAVAARLEGVPVVWQILDTFPPMWFRRIMMPLVMRTAGAIMSTGQRVAEEHPGIERARDRLICFYPPVDVDRFRPDPASGEKARNKLGLSDDALVIGNVSNLNPQKGHATFLHAAAALKRERADVRFVILGQRYEAHARYIEELFELAESLGLQFGDDLIVQDPGADVAELASAFDVFWMTSEPRSEGIPTVIEEAMALGLPVVSTNVGSIGEIVREGETGYIVPPYDVGAIAARTKEIVSSHSLRSSLTKKARDAAVQRFSVENCAQRHFDAYQVAERFQ